MQHLETLAALKLKPKTKVMVASAIIRKTYNKLTGFTEYDEK